jgi:hypothetical protein
MGAGAARQFGGIGAGPSDQGNSEKPLSTNMRESGSMIGGGQFCACSAGAALAPNANAGDNSPQTEMAATVVTREIR